MAIQSHTTSTPTGVSETSEFSGVYVEGVVGGMIGAATIAIRFFIVDLYNGRPFYTPNVLGAALSLSRSIPDPAAAPISMELVVFYTWVHALIFCAIGGLAAKLLSLAERDLHFGFGNYCCSSSLSLALSLRRWFSPNPSSGLWHGRQSSSAIYSRRVRWQSTFGAIIRSCGSHRE